MGPTILAFRAGGFFDGPRAVAAVTAWALVAFAAVCFERPLPTGAPARVALAALAGLCLWVGLGASWAPLGGPAQNDLIRDLLYLAVLLLAASAWRRRAELRHVEPVLAAGVLVVVGYGLAGRLLPDLVEQTVSISADGRLDQPLTYWNAMGALAAIGVVLCARLCGDDERRETMRLAAAATAAPLGAGVFLSLSRGAIAALVVGLVTLLALAPSRAQLRAVLVALAAGALAALVASLLPGVESLDGSESALRRDGLLMLGALVLIALGAMLAARAFVVRQASGTVPGPLRSALVWGALVAMLAAPFAVVLIDDGDGSGEPAKGAARLGDVGSNRYDYWKVAAGQFADSPLRGEGPGSFEIAWKREREIEESVSDAHSLPIETAAELGLVGLALLALLTGAVAMAARRACRADAMLAAGPAAALTVWAVHACLDWDWEMPALTLLAIVLAGALLAADELSAPPAG